MLPMNSEAELTEAALALQRLAACVRDLMPRSVALQADGSGSPRMLALRDTFTAFPAPAEVLFIDGTGFPDSRDSNAAWTLIRFDMTQPRTSAMKFAAAVAAADLPHHRDMLEEHFGVDDDLWKAIRDLRLVANWCDCNYMFLAPYDIRTQPEKYAIEFVRSISDDWNFRELFLSEPDFNAKYGLKPDPVLSAEELLRIDFSTGMPTSQVLRQFTLQELQEKVADIQPIEQVPESVREVIRRAKKLYVYGFFEYAFFTVALHYAYAAMEAALKKRWGASLPRPTRLTLSRAGGKEETDVERTGYAEIESYCDARGWRTNNLLVNGRQFPRTSTMVLNWLKDDGVISDYQKAMFEKAYLPLRNSHSHMEHCSTWMPDARALRQAVEQINILFDSLASDTVQKA
jgi:hypothetical protein